MSDNMQIGDIITVEMPDGKLLKAKVISLEPIIEYQKNVYILIGRCVTKYMSFKCGMFYSTDGKGHVDFEGDIYYYGY